MKLDDLEKIRLLAAQLRETRRFFESATTPGAEVWIGAYDSMTGSYIKLGSTRPGWSHDITCLIVKELEELEAQLEALGVEV